MASRQRKTSRSPKSSDRTGAAGPDATPRENGVPDLTFRGFNWTLFLAVLLMLPMEAARLLFHLRPAFARYHPDNVLAAPLAIDDFAFAALRTMAIVAILILFVWLWLRTFGDSPLSAALAAIIGWAWSFGFLFSAHAIMRLFPPDVLLWECALTLGEYLIVAQVARWGLRPALADDDGPAS